MKSIKRVLVVLVLSGVVLGTAGVSQARAPWCRALYTFLGSPASDGLSNADYFGLVSTYNENC